MAYIRIVLNDKSVICSSVSTFFLFYDQDGKEGMFKVMKNDHFLVFLVLCVIFHNILGR